MKPHLRTMLIALASVPIALVSTGFAAVAWRPDAPSRTALGQSPSDGVGLHFAHAFADQYGTTADPGPSASPSPSPSSSPAAAASTAPADTPATSDVASARPRTNLTAVFDRNAVPVRDGYRVRVGVRNSGPLSISAPAGQSAATFRLSIAWSGPVTSLGDCEYHPEIPPFLELASIAYFECRSGPTLRVGQTYWESFVFPNLSYFAHSVRIEATGYAEDPNTGDNWCDVVVRVASSGLPVTGTSPLGVAGAGVALMVVGVIAIWYGRRRRAIQPTADPGQAFTDGRPS
jgi:hypothetical protein